MERALQVINLARLAVVLDYFFSEIFLASVFSQSDVVMFDFQAWAIWT